MTDQTFTGEHLIQQREREVIRFAEAVADQCGRIFTANPDTPAADIRKGIDEAMVPLLFAVGALREARKSPNEMPKANGDLQPNEPIWRGGNALVYCKFCCKTHAVEDGAPICGDMEGMWIREG